MRRTFRGVLPLIFLLPLAGCGSGVSWVATDPVALSPKPGKYEMPVMNSSPTRPHRVLGELRVSCSIEPSFNKASTYDQALTRLKKEAVKKGADAITEFQTLDSQGKNRRGRLTLVGTLVIFTAPEPLSSTN